MIINSDITIYHKTLNSQTRLEEYIKYYYPNCWKFNKKGSTNNKGYSETNIIEVRIPYISNSNMEISNFAIGDIICIGNGKNVISGQDELNGEAYNIVSIANNKFGTNPHIHIGGK